MTPAEIVASTLHDLLCEAQGRQSHNVQAATVLDALAGAGMVVVPQELPVDTVTIPREAYDRLVKVAEYVSMGRGYVGVKPYPDATARAALGALPGREGKLVGGDPLPERSTDV